MKFRTLSRVGSIVSEIIVIILATLVLGGLGARAAGPVLTLPASVTLGEDTTTNLGFRVSDSAVAIFTVITTASSSSTNLVSNSSLAFNGSGTNRLLSIRPGLHKFGTNTITIIATDSQPASVTNTFTLNVVQTNYPPVFLKTIANQTKNENAASTNLSFTISDIETPASSLAVTVTSTNLSLTASNGLVLSGTGTNRTLTLMPAANQNGTSLIELVVTDGGGAKATNDFMLNVLSVNQPPTFTMSTNRLSFRENFGSVSNLDFISNISSGPANQAAESNYFILNYTTNFFAQAPVLNPTNGQLSFQVVSNQFGTNAITFVLFNSGSTTNGGKISLTNTLTLNVSYVNQTPSFALPTNLVAVSEESAGLTNAGFVTSISSGPANESGQTWTFATTTTIVSSNSASAPFTVLPTIATNGTLKFVPTPHTYGTYTVRVAMTDSGGTNNGAVNSYVTNFAITVAQIAHAPGIMGSTNRTVLENGSVAGTINVWDYDAAGPNLVLSASSSNTNVAVAAVSAGSVGTTNALFTLTCTAGTNVFGPATITLTASELNFATNVTETYTTNVDTTITTNLVSTVVTNSLTTSSNLTLTVLPVSQPPSFAMTNLLTVAEESGLKTNAGFVTSINVGAGNAAGTTWTFRALTSTNYASTNAHFTVLPAIATNGTLTFAAAAHSYGTNLVTVIMTDSGVVTNGGMNSSTNSFTLAVAQIAHAPGIMGSTNRTVLENGSVAGTINVWDYDAAGPNLVLSASSSNTNVAVAAVSAGSVGTTNALFTLTCTAGTNVFGPATITLTASELNFATNVTETYTTNVDTTITTNLVSTVVTNSLTTSSNLTLTVLPVSQPPSFAMTNLLTVAEESGLKTNAGFVTSINVGAGNAAGTTWTFRALTSTNYASTNAHFTVLPAIATNGTLTFAAAAHSYGTNLVTVIMTDSGVVTNGGMNSSTNSFTLAVAQIAHAPGIMGSTNRTVLENGSVAGTINVWDYDAAGPNLVLSASSSNTNVAVAAVSAGSVGTTNALFTLTCTAGTNVFGPATITLTASELNFATNVTETYTTNVDTTITTNLVSTVVTNSLTTSSNLTLTVLPVSQPPSFAMTNLLTVAEESGLKTNAGFVTSINVGAGNAAGTTWTFRALTSTNYASTNAHFTVLPAIATNGTLTFAAAAHSYGTNLVTVIMTDSGVVTNGGMNSSTNSFTLAVAQIAHAPGIMGSTNRTVLENGSVAGTINVWDYDAAGPNLVLSASSSNTNVAVAAVSAGSVGTTNALFTLTCTAGTNVFGPATITLTASELNFATNVTETYTTNVDTTITTNLVSTVVTNSLTTSSNLTLTVLPVSQPPSFAMTNLLTVAEESGLKTNAGFVTSINVGAGNAAGTTWTFRALTSTNYASTNAHFTVLPAIATNGTLTFAAAAHSYGTNLVTVIMTDSGVVTNGGMNSSTNSFTLAVAQIAHAPGIMGSTNRTVLENGSVAGTINVWDYDAAGPNLVLSASSSNTNVAVAAVSAGSVGTTNALFTLTCTAGTNVFGPATITLTASELNFATNVTETYTTNVDTTITTNLVSTVVTNSLTTSSNLTLTVLPVSQPPSFAFSTNILTVAENAGQTTNAGFVTAINVGAGNAAGTTWTFRALTSTNYVSTNAHFTVLPSVATNGTLSFKTGNYSYGTNLVTVIMTDSGVVTNGGVNSYTNSFQLEVIQGQYPPAFTGLLTNKTILENATTNLSMPFTLFDPLTTNFNVSCSSADTNVVTVSVTGTGTARTLWFAPVTNAFGSNITVTVTADDGTLTNSATLPVTVVWVNQAPSFSLTTTSVTVNQFDAAVSIPNAATNILAGPTNESSQTVSFIVTNSKPSLFLGQPTVSSSGTLMFTPAKTGGTVSVGIKVHDNGGTNNGGVDTSAVQMLTITIPPNPFQVIGGSFTGLFYDTNTAAVDSSGYFSLTSVNDGTFAGYFLCAGTSNAFNGQFSIANSNSAYANVTVSSYTLNLSLDTSGDWSESVTGSVTNSTAGWNAELLGYLPGYSANFPTTIDGANLMVMPGFDDSTAGPAGDSIFNIVISPAGIASFTGYLADNTAVSQANTISIDGYCPVYIPLYGSDHGLLIGWVDFTGDSIDSVSTNSTLAWLCKAGATTLYPNGFTNSAMPQASTYDSTLANLLGSTTGTVILSGGNLDAPITNTVTISGNTVTVDPSATNGLSLFINSSTGELLGSFLSPGNHTNYVDSAILQGVNVAPGYFIGDTTNWCGSFILYGN